VNTEDGTLDGAMKYGLSPSFFCWRRGIFLAFTTGSLVSGRAMENSVPEWSFLQGVALIEIISLLDRL
jgi:hypothetical protein